MINNVIFGILCGCLYVVGLPFGWDYKETSLHLHLSLAPALCNFNIANKFAVDSKHSEWQKGSFVVSGSAFRNGLLIYLPFHCRAFGWALYAIYELRRYRWDI